MKIWIENAGGAGDWLAKSGRGRRLPGGGRHVYVDRTDEPMATLTTVPPSLILERKMGLLVESATGHKGARGKKLKGRGHAFRDASDAPMPAVMAGRPVELPQTPGAAAKVNPDKPPYRVPPMAAIRKIKPNGFRVMSTFAGCGGSSLGYRMAGFEVIWANEFISIARDSYKANSPKTVLDGRDIRKIDPLAVLKELGLKPGELDVFDGSPPCTSFSTAGVREKGWGKEKLISGEKWSRADDLFFEYVRFVKAIQPKVFVAENVSGLVKGVAKGYFIQILTALKACGYQVEAKLLDAQWLGVPQQRQRIIFVGVRNNLGIKPAFPVPLRYRYSIREALPWLDSVVHDTKGERSAGEVIDRPAPTVTVGGIAQGTAAGGSNANHFKARVAQGSSVDWKNKGRVIDASKPAPAIAAGNAARRTPSQFEVVIHPTGSSGRRRRENKRPYSVDAPAPTIQASKGFREKTQFQVEVSSNKNYKQTWRGIDEPAPAGSKKKTFRRVVDKDGVRRQIVSAEKPAPTIMAGGIGGVGHDQYRLNVPPVEPESDISRYAIGAEWDKLKPGEKSNRYFQMVKSDPDAPALAVIASAGNFESAASATHPFERRKFSIAELRRLCGFPDDFALVGTYGQQWERMGNSVPPVMMSHIAAAVRGILEEAARRSRKPPTSRGKKKGARRPLS